MVLNNIVLQIEDAEDRIWRSKHNFSFTPVLNAPDFQSFNFVIIQVDLCWQLFGCRKIMLLHLRYIFMKFKEIYITIQLGCLAIAYALKGFRHYLFGKN